MCIPMTPNHIRMITSCYPASSALLATAPDYRPNSQELSRLTYYASNRPGKLTKLTNYLEKRAKSEAAKAGSGNAKAKASLLITLAILRALTTECRRELPLFSRAIIVSINISLTSAPNDIEVAARAASVFTAWTTYTDGNLIGMDDALTQAYLSVLSHYARLSVVVNEKDGELRNRTRLLGLAALSGVLSSDALYASLPEFRRQIPVIVPPLVANLETSAIPLLNEVYSAIEASPQPTSPYLAEMPQRPPLSERRAASIHVHIDGEKGPSSLDVVEAALRALRTVFQLSAAVQIAASLQAIVHCLELHRSWSNVEFCCWLADKAISWSQYQYRFAVPTKIVEMLLAAQDSPLPTSKLTSLTAMLTTVFTSPISLVNFSTLDVLTNLVTLILRRVAIDPDDGLLPPLVQSTAALGTHVYYADQVQDLAEELITRLVGIELNGLPGGSSAGDGSRQAAMRCIILCLKGLIEAANQGIAPQKRQGSVPTITHENVHEAADARDSAMERHDSSNVIRDDYSTNPRRNHLSPEVWQETLALLCESDFDVRSPYADALVTFLLCEVAREPFLADHALAAREEGRVRLPVTGRSVLATDSTSRFLHALHVSAFHLALSPCLGISSTPPSEASDDRDEPGAVHVSPPTPLGSPGASTMDEAEGSYRHTLAHTHRLHPGTNRGRSPSRVLFRLLETPNTTSSNDAARATLADYAHLLAILSTVHRRVPARALIVGIPMLLALDTAACTALQEPDANTQGRSRAVKELLGRVWKEIGNVWSIKEIEDVADKALAALPQPSLLTDPVVPPLGTTYAAQEQGAYPHAAPHDEDGSSPPKPFINAEAVVSALVGNERVQAVIGLDRQGLWRRLAAEWTPESALKESVERTSGLEVFRSDGGVLRKISPALMHIDNISLQSVARSGKGVGVGDLRDALEGRAGASSVSISTFEQASSAHGGGLLVPPSSRPLSSGRGALGAQKTSPAEVRDALNKLGVGKQAQGHAKLRSPFPVVQRPETDQKTPVLVPPYRS